MEWNLVMSLLTFLAILVALFGRDWVDWLKRPNLQLSFNMGDNSYFHEILLPLFQHGNYVHYSEGRNCLLKISNVGRQPLFFLKTQTALAVEAKVTYVVHGGQKHTYHPTYLKWSGADEERPVSIIAGSHHFLDFIKFYNYEHDLWIEEAGLVGHLKKSAIRADSAPVPLPKTRIYFEPWFPQYYQGITKTFDGDETYKIYFVINGENCGPYKYVAVMKWSKAGWDKPRIEIRESTFLEERERGLH